MMLNASRRYAPWLWLLLALFAARVIAQPLAQLTDAPLLPFEAWHSGVLPYPLLFVTQVGILVWLAWTALRFSTGVVVPHSRRGTIALVLASVYFTVMAARLALGATILHDSRWFGSLLPTVFHLVLASYLLVYGTYHHRHGVAHRVASQRVQ